MFLAVSAVALTAPRIHLVRSRLFLLAVLRLFLLGLLVGAVRSLSLSPLLVRLLLLALLPLLLALSPPLSTLLLLLLPLLPLGPSLMRPMAVCVQLLLLRLVLVIMLTRRLGSRSGSVLRRLLPLLSPQLPPLLLLPLLPLLLLLVPLMWYPSLAMLCRPSRGQLLRLQPVALTCSDNL